MEFWALSAGGRNHFLMTKVLLGTLNSYHLCVHLYSPTQKEAGSDIVHNLLLISEGVIGINVSHWEYTINHNRWGSGWSVYTIS